MSRRLDLLNKRFGRLLVVGFDGVRNSKTYWMCLCDCGKSTVISGVYLMSGTKSCGCLLMESIRTHGESGSKEHDAWTHMKQRCYNAAQKQWVDYGGRGIIVCARWLNSFENFLADMGRCPDDRTLDRKDNNGNYSPENCRWATRAEQDCNKRSNVFLEQDGKIQTLAQWAFELGMNYKTIQNRYRRGHSVKSILFKGKLQKWME